MQELKKMKRKFFPVQSPTNTHLLRETRKKLLKFDDTSFIFSI